MAKNREVGQRAVWREIEKAKNCRSTRGKIRRGIKERREVVPVSVFVSFRGGKGPERLRRNAGRQTDGSSGEFGGRGWPIKKEEEGGPRQGLRCCVKRIHIIGDLHSNRQQTHHNKKKEEERSSWLRKKAKERASSAGGEETGTEKTLAIARGPELQGYSSCSSLVERNLSVEKGKSKVGTDKD